MKRISFKDEKKDLKEFTVQNLANSTLFASSQKYFLWNLDQSEARTISSKELSPLKLFLTKLELFWSEVNEKTNIKFRCFWHYSVSHFQTKTQKTFNDHFAFCCWYISYVIEHYKNETSYSYQCLTNSDYFPPLLALYSSLLFIIMPPVLLFLRFQR
jgi:hypothetical protein